MQLTTFPADLPVLWRAPVRSPPHPIFPGSPTRHGHGGTRGTSWLPEGAPRDLSHGTRFVLSCTPRRKGKRAWHKPHSGSDRAEGRSRVPGTQALQSQLRLAGQQAGGQLQLSAPPVLGAELRTSKQREESSPSG